MTITLDDLQRAEERLFTTRKKYLEERGWKYTCQTPGSMWLWSKTYMDDRYMCNMTMALVVEEALSGKTNNKR